MASLAEECADTGWIPASFRWHCEEKGWFVQERRTCWSIRLRSIRARRLETSTTGRRIPFGRQVCDTGTI